MPHVVGLEIGPDRVRAIEVQGTPRALTVTRFAEEPIQPPAPPAEGQTTPPPEPLTAALDALFSRHGLPRGPIVAGIDAGQMMFRHVQVPFTADHHIRETLPSEIEHHVFNVSAENAVVDFYKVRQAENASLLFVGTTPKEVVNRHLRAMAACGIDPIALDVDLMALFNCLARCGVFADKPNCVVLSLDVSVNRLVIVQGGRLHSARTFRVAAPVSSSTLGEKSADKAPLHGRPAEGGEQKLQFHLDAAHAGALAATLHAPSNWREYAARVEQEVSRAILAFPPADPPTAVVLAGGLPDLKERTADLGAALRLPVEIFEPSRHFEGPYFANGSAAGAAGLPVALGLALKGMEYDVGGMDFRKYEFRYEKRFDAIKRALLACAALVLMFFALVGFHFLLRRRLLERTLGDGAGLQAGILQNTYPDLPPPAEGTAPLRHLLELAEQEHNLYGRTDTPLILSSLDVWKMAFEEIMKFNMDVKKISIDQSRGQMRALIDGSADSRSTIEQVLNRLKSKPDFPNASIQGGTGILPDGRYSYQYLIPRPERPSDAQ
ncbi:MAG: hypothetical protein HYY93_02150 [Planctomycetes bacterium]|nr:hypothetical protein [Planctomycetota bacterium]